MQKELRGSEQVQGLCSRLSELTPEQIAEVAGGLGYFEAWMIRGIPADFFKAKTLPAVQDIAQLGAQIR